MRLLCTILPLLLLTETAFAGDPESLLKNMKPSWKKVNDYTCEMKSQARNNGKLGEAQISALKFRKASDIYAKKLTSPNKNAEAIYRGPTWNDGKLKGNKGSFPNLTLSVDIYSKMALSEGLHPITHAPFNYIIDVVLGDFNKARAEGVDAIKDEGADKVDGRACTKVSFSTNPKAGAWYTPQEKDSWLSIAKANKIDFVALRYHNPGKKPNDTSAKLWVPSYYASKWELCIDDASGLPISYKGWDADGNLFEVNSTSKLKLNIGLTDLDFDPDNEAYQY
jgi:Protein of unknown function (DUF1571)